MCVTKDLDPTRGDPENDILSGRKVFSGTPGSLKEGYFADITVFDPLAVRDTATFADPKQYPVGIPYVVVNGEVVIKEWELTGALPGKVLLRSS